MQKQQLIPNHALQCMQRGNHFWNKQISKPNPILKYIQYIKIGEEEKLQYGQAAGTKKGPGKCFIQKTYNNGNIVPLTIENYPEAVVIKPILKKIKHYV